MDNDLINAVVIIAALFNLYVIVEFLRFMKRSSKSLEAQTLLQIRMAQKLGVEDDKLKAIVKEI